MNKANVCGVTPEHCLPTCPPCVFIQLCETDKLSVPATDPDIDEIVHVHIRIKVRKFKTLCTVVGRKLAIYANKEIELVTKSNCIRFVSRYCIPFCAFIMLDDMEDRVIDVKAVIEDIDVIQAGTRCVAISAFIMFYPEFGCMDDPKCDDNSICCDIALNHYLPAHQKHLIGR